MADKNGFKNIKRTLPKTEAPQSRVAHFNEMVKPTNLPHKKDQAARCMDCGVPFCHNGCPLGNNIPDFNDAVYHNDWKLAYEILDSTNNFPEFTGRICPAPCEASCVLGINNDPVTIEYIEKSIIEKAFEEAWVQPNANIKYTSKKVAVVGSGPAGLACADQLNKAGHAVTVFEKSDRIGGLLRYGIPDFKLAKNIIDRRLAVMEDSGIVFKTNTNVGLDITATELEKDFDAIVLCGGSSVPRDLPVEGRKLKGIHFAMEYLTENNKKVAGDQLKHYIDVKDKKVLVIGGGDTGSDCIGTSNRLGAASILQIELMAKLPNARTTDNPWPQWPMILRTSSSQEEGCDREWSVMTKAFVSEDGVNLSGVKVVEIEWKKDANGKHTMCEIPGTEKVIPCDVAFLAIGFVHPLKDALLTDLNVELDVRQNVKTQNYKTSSDKVFAAGDMRRGQSLVVWAISEGREAAVAVDEYLTESPSLLLQKEASLLAV